MKKLLATLAVLMGLGQVAGAVVTSTANSEQWAGNGTTTQFTFGFPFFCPGITGCGSENDLQASLTVISSGLPDSPQPVLNGGGTYGYTLSCASPASASTDNVTECASGTFAFNTAPPAGDLLTIQRSVPATQGLNLLDNAKFPAGSVNGALDRAAMVQQQALAGLALAIAAPATDPAGLNYTLPPAPARALQMLGFDASGNAIAAQPASAPVSSALQGVTAAASINAALQALGVAGANTNVFDPRWYGFVGDGAAHPLSGSYATLAAAQAVYPLAKSLTDEIDGEAMQAALCAAMGAPGCNTGVAGSPYQGGGTVLCPPTMWRFNEPLYLPSNVALIGLGGGLNAQALPAPVSSATNVKTCLGYWDGAAAGDNLGTAAVKSLNRYQASVPAFSGTVSSATSTTLVFNAASVPGIGAATFVGAILVIDGQQRTVSSGAWSSPNYTATIGNPWTTTPSGGDTLSIAAQARGAPYPGIDSLAGNCLSYAFSYANGIRVENVAIATDSEWPVGFDFQCAAHAVVKNTAAVNFNVGRVWDESYYVDDRDAFDVSRQQGILISGGTWGVITQPLEWPLIVAGSSPADIYRPSASDRMGVVAATIASGTDPGYYLATGLYGSNAVTLTILGGDLGEGADRGVFWAGGSAKLNLLGTYFERQGIYPVGGPAKTGATSLWQNGANVTMAGIGWFRSHSGGDHLVPLAAGCSPFLTLEGANPSLDDANDALAAPTFGYSSTLCGGSDSFRYSGVVAADAGTAPTTGDTAPYNADQLGASAAPASFSWARFPAVPTQVTGNVTLNACAGTIGVSSSNGAFTVTLPATVSPGLTCTIYDQQDDAATHNITIASQTGNFVNGSGVGTTSMKITTNDGEAIVQWTGSASGWGVVLQR